MSWFSWTRKNKNLNTSVINTRNNYPNVPTIIPSLSKQKYTPRSAERQQFFKKFAEEIVNVWRPKANNPVNQYVERNYETEASSYLRKLYLELNQKNQRNFINRKLQEFQRNISTIPLSPEAKQIVLSKLRKLKLYQQILQNIYTNTRKNRNRRPSARPRFSSETNNTSNTESIDSTSSLPSLKQLRNELGPNAHYVHRPRRRLKGVVRPNQGRQPPEGV
jgi:hypothetical protein